MEATNSQQIRRALRAYHCHGCDRDFKEMVNLNDLSGLACPNCQCGFVEEKKSYEENKNAPMPQPQPAPQQPRMQSQPQPAPQMHHQHQQFQQFPQMPQMQQMMGGHQAQGSFGMPQMGHQGRRQQVFQQTYSPRSGWSQSVTITYGPDGQVRQQMSSAQFPQASAQMHQPGAQAQAQAQQQANSQPQPQANAQQEGPFHGQDPFAAMNSFFGGGAFGGLFGMPQRDGSPRQGGMPFDPAAMMGSFFGEGFPMGQNRPGSAGCTEEYIRNLPEKDKGKEGDCYICLEKCKDGKESCQLPCEHAFDRSCIEQWLKEHDSCPVCRVKLNQERPRPQQQNQMPGGPQVFFFN